jgi:hypothetical protein
MATPLAMVMTLYDRLADRLEQKKTDGVSQKPTGD